MREAISLEVQSPVEKLKNGRCFRELKTELSIAESFDDVIEVAGKMYCN